MHHGMGALVSPHEIFGCLAEEFTEAQDEMHANNDKKFADELLDIAVAAILGVASLDIEKKN